MGFLNTYLKKYRLDEMPEKHKEHLEKLEKEIAEKSFSSNADFEECIKKFGPALADLIDRAAAGLKDVKVSLSTLRWIINIGIETHQLVEQMVDFVVDDEMTPAEAREAKIEFGKELTYFIWKAIDPLAKYLYWLPFRQTLEREIVKWMAGLVMEATVDLLAAQRDVKTFADGGVVVAMRAVPVAKEGS